MLTIAVVVGAMLMTADEGLTTGPIETVGEGYQFTEGPVWLPSGRLAFSDIPADTIYYADRSVLRKPSGNSNGLTLDPQGRLISCEHGNRRVARTESDGSITVLADNYQGKKLNSPNDATVRSDGTIFFTDPPYGLAGREAELDFNGVYAIRPDGTLTLLAKDFNRPNGLVLSVDEKTLYVADTAESHIRAFNVAEDGSLSNGRVHCEVPSPDGIRIDTEGRIWATSRLGIVVVNSDGEQAGVIEFPQWPANCTFGGSDSKTLFVTARTGVYKVECAVPGVVAGKK